MICFCWFVVWMCFCRVLGSLCCDFYCLVCYCLHSWGSEFADSGALRVWLCCIVLPCVGCVAIICCVLVVWVISCGFVLWCLWVGLLVVCFCFGCGFRLAALLVVCCIGLVFSVMLWLWFCGFRSLLSAAGFVGEVFLGICFGFGVKCWIFVVFGVLGLRFSVSLVLILLWLICVVLVGMVVYAATWLFVDGVVCGCSLIVLFLRI